MGDAMAFSIESGTGRRDRRRPWAFRLRALALLVSGSLLATCGGTVQEVRLRIAGDEHGTIVARISAPILPAQRNDPDNSFSYKEAETRSGRIAHCGVHPTLYTHNGTVRLDLHAEFTNAAAANRMWTCAAPDAQEPSIALERTPGMLWDTYVTTISLRNETLPCETCTQPPHLFPRSMFLTVPGDAGEPHDLSDILGARVDFHHLGGDTVRADVRTVGNYGQTSRAYFSRHPGQNHKNDVLSFQVTSSSPNYNLGHVIQVLGLLFGSGFVLGFAKWLFNRRRRADGAISASAG